MNFRHFLLLSLSVFAGCAAPMARPATATLATEGLPLAAEPAEAPAPAPLPSAEPAPASSSTPAVEAADPWLDVALQPEPGSPLRKPNTQSLRPSWEKGEWLLQGYIGVSFIDDVQQSGGSFPPIDASDLDIDTLPIIGGGGQVKLAGKRVDFGLEAGLDIAFRAGSGLIAAGGGGLLVAVNFDLFALGLWGGPFLSAFLGDKVRLYGALGPWVQFANYYQTVDGAPASGSGFGVGYYTRAGLEFILSSRTMIGLGARWTDTTIDLSGGLGDLDVRGTQVFLTVTTGL